MLYARLAMVPFTASVALTVNVYVPAVSGMPVDGAVWAFNFSPLGRSAESWKVWPRCRR